MEKKTVKKICMKYLSQEPTSIERCSMGIGNYVFIVTIADEKYVFRGSEEEGAYNNTSYLLDKLKNLDIPIPKIICSGKFEKYYFIILSYIVGEEIGDIYRRLTDSQKKNIAREIVKIQNEVSRIQNDIEIPADFNWKDIVLQNLNRSKSRIDQNGYFDSKKVDKLIDTIDEFNEYFYNVRPIPYLDDISSKNLLISNGEVSGIIDIDWLAFGDKLTYVALTNMAFLDYGYDTDYIDYILSEMNINEKERRVFLFYTLMCCVDFMGERGMTFLDKTIYVDETVLEKFNELYEDLLRQFLEA